MKKTLTLVVFAILLLLGYSFQSGKSMSLQLENSRPVSEPMATRMLENVETQLVKAVAAPASKEVSVNLEDKIAKLESELEKLEEEIQTIDIEKELNSSETSKERRAEIIGKANTYALKMGELARLEAQSMNMEETQ